jgi:hypothetical protein
VTTAINLATTVARVLVNLNLAQPAHPKAELVFSVGTVSSRLPLVRNATTIIGLIATVVLPAAKLKRQMVGPVKYQDNPVVSAGMGFMKPLVSYATTVTSTTMTVVARPVRLKRIGNAKSYREPYVVPVTFAAMVESVYPNNVTTAT